MCVNLRCAALITLTIASGAAETGFAEDFSPAPVQIAIGSTPAGLDPHLVTAFNSVAIVNGTIYEGLTAIDKDLQVRHGLAESELIDRLRRAVETAGIPIMTSATAATLFAEADGRVLGIVAKRPDGSGGRASRAFATSLTGLPSGRLRLYARS